jgi:hypothetical protein
MPKKQCGKNLYQVIRETINWRVVVIKLLSPKKNFLPNLSAKYRLRLMRARPPLFFEIPPNDLSAIDFRNQVGGWSDKREFFFLYTCSFSLSRLLLAYAAKMSDRSLSSFHGALKKYRTRR